MTTDLRVTVPEKNNTLRQVVNVLEEPRVPPSGVDLPVSFSWAMDA